MNRLSDFLVSSTELIIRFGRDMIRWCVHSFGVWSTLVRFSRFRLLRRSLSCYHKELHLAKIFEVLVNTKEDEKLRSFQKPILVKRLTEKLAFSSASKLRRGLDRRFATTQETACGGEEDSISFRQLGEMGIQIIGQIEKIHGKELSYDDFAERFLAKNQPVVISDLTEDWRARDDWVGEEGRPNLDFIATHFGKSRVQVADCDVREYTDQRRLEMSVMEFVKQWTENATEDNGTSDDNGGKSVLYLKDWHFVKEYPDYTAYKTPPLFCDDWLNIYLDNYHMHEDVDNLQKYDQISCSDYRFVYMGRKGSWTPLHADVFRSYSWSANVCGRKRWLFLPPPQCHLVYDRYMNNCVYNIFEEANETKFPGFKETTWLECIQEPGDIIFVPSGWHHQVYNLEDTISINHNWLNAYNLSWVWDLLWKDYKETEKSIEDVRDICDDFEALCQRNLAANTGMNFNDFFMFMSRFSLGNMFLLQSYSCSSAVTQNLLLNLSTIRKIMTLMISAGGVTAKEVYLDLGETLEGPQFLRLVRDMGRTYGMIHMEEKNHVLSSKELLQKLTGFADQKMQICSPKDLVDMINQHVLLA